MRRPFAGDFRCLMKGPFSGRLSHQGGPLPQMLILAFVPCAVLLPGLAVTIPAYARLLRFLREDHPTEYAAMGSPTLWSRSPEKSLALQRFLYRGSRAAHISERVTKLSRFLAVFTPVFVSALLGAIAWATIAGAMAMGR